MDFLGFMGVWVIVIVLAGVIKVAGMAAKGELKIERGKGKSLTLSECFPYNSSKKR